LHNKRFAFGTNSIISIVLIMTQTKISKAFQTTISAEAIRILGLRPGQRVNQIVEGKRLVLEPVEDADALAGSLGRGKRRTHSIQEIKAAARKGITKAGAAGLEAD
jgi:bifunctional DNA-binding transcriptional regulator/antitoxin component of YhaV-PrlF toxin-antitoxin module